MLQQVRQVKSETVKMSVLFMQKEMWEVAYVVLV